MSAERDALLMLLGAVEGLAQHAEAHPSDYMRWSRPQLEYLSLKAKYRLLRTGNRFGKSLVALADVRWRARKDHPYRPDWNARIGPQHQWIVGVSWDQLIPLMRVFRRLLDADELESAPAWSFRKGWGKDSPCLVFRNGSSVTWKTMDQDTRAHAGAELDHVLIDEPPAEESWREIERRVVTRAGEVSLTLTPVNAPGPLDWLKGLAADEIVKDLHFRMTEEIFRFADTGELRTLPDGTVQDAAWIAQQERQVLPRWRGIVLHGEWDEIVVDGEFSGAFSDLHVSDFTLDGREVFSIGIDHGTKGYTETAVLVAVDETTEYPSIYVLDCYSAPENSPAEKDAQAIIAMLGRHRVKGVPLRWKSLKCATGDIPHHGGRGKIGRKSNKELSYELAKAMGLGRDEALSPPLWQAKSGKGADPRGSVMRGLQWLHHALLRPGQLTIHPRCTALIEAFHNYRGGSEDPHGHLMDALRYALDPWIRRGQTRTAAPITLRV